jgi:lipoprotein-anchoring transpeptidase ErfK/SrfK
MAWLTRPRGAAVTATAAAVTLALGSVILIPASAVPGPAASPAPRATQAPATVAQTPATQTTPAPSSASPAPTAPAKPKKIKPASKTKKAKNVPERPRDTHTGKRIVYDKALMTVWLMDKRNQVVGRYPVVGRWDRPAKGTYRVFSKSDRSGNPNSKVTFNHMVRFTYGPDTKSPIGFHSIPRYYDGSRMHPVSSLGLPIATGGCIRMADKDAKAVYDFMNVGDLVVVLPSP